ncbi:SET domain protein [Calycina marina]|uniref:SET domain protein n=1 Tax=Calycina marina TaxID=1763456 RepID=A0A9P8CD34_9HELO|nr:SET domain protein [Calycina marina]
MSEDRMPTIGIKRDWKGKGKAESSIDSMDDDEDSMPAPKKNLKWERHFYYHEEKDFMIADEEIEDCHWCQINAFPTAEPYPITITNFIDESTLPDDFRFIDKSVLHQKIDLAPEEFRSGCGCRNTGDCKYAGCNCLEDMDFDMEEALAMRQKVYSYHSQGEKAECLRGTKLHSRNPIYECHKGCECDTSCSNRVVERGRKIPLNIFKTENRGWGVRSSVKIRKGQFIDLYVGHIITSQEADRRRKKSEFAQRKDVYLFALDKFSDPESADPRLRRKPYEVDGEFMSGPTRFINHSCDPNLRIFARVGDHADKHIHDLAFFAIKDIAPMTELTFDYVDGESAPLLKDSKNDDKVKDMTKCLCGSRKCRGFLW